MTTTAFNIHQRYYAQNCVQLNASMANNCNSMGLRLGFITLEEYQCRSLATEKYIRDEYDKIYEQTKLDAVGTTLAATTS